MNIKSSNQSRANKPPQKQKRPPKKITETYLHNSGLYYLQRYAASSGHFRQVMIRKARKSCIFHEDQRMEDCLILIDALVQKFIKAGLLDDETYTRGVVNSMRRQGKSRRSIVAKLKEKNLAEDLIAQKLEEHQQEDDTIDAELRAALVFARKKRFGPYQSGKNIEFEKMLSSMGRAGFGYDTSRRVLEMDTAEAETLTRL